MERFPSYEEQVSLVATSRVVITEHGAFDTNLIFMHPGCLFIEMRGAYHVDSYNDFENLANLFRVYHLSFVAADLRSHTQSEYVLSPDDMKNIANYIFAYFSSRSLQQNTSWFGAIWKSRAS